MCKWALVLTSLSHKPGPTDEIIHNSDVCDHFKERLHILNKYLYWNFIQYTREKNYPTWTYSSFLPTFTSERKHLQWNHCTIYLQYLQCPYFATLAWHITWAFAPQSALAWFDRSPVTIGLPAFIAVHTRSYLSIRWGCHSWLSHWIINTERDHSPFKRHLQAGKIIRFIFILIQKDMKDTKLVTGMKLAAGWAITVCEVDVDGLKFQHVSSKTYFKINLQQTVALMHVPLNSQIWTLHVSRKDLEINNNKKKIK